MAKDDPTPVRERRAGGVEPSVAGEVHADVEDERAARSGSAQRAQRRVQLARARGPVERDPLPVSHGNRDLPVDLRHRVQGRVLRTHAAPRRGRRRAHGEQPHAERVAARAAHPLDLGLLPALRQRHPHPAGPTGSMLGQVAPQQRVGLRAEVRKPGVVGERRPLVHHQHGGAVGGQPGAGRDLLVRWPRTLTG
jgi:hypothetical protein